MGLNDLQLNGALVAGLYTNTLVEIGDPAGKKNDIDSHVPAIEPVSAASWKHLGENRKQVLVMVDYPGLVHLPDEELKFLTSMLTACKLSLADVAIHNRANNPSASSTEALSHFRSKTVFLFGIEPAQWGLPVNFPEFQVQSVAGSTFLYAPALENFRDDKLLKSKLWICLKRIFSI